MIKNLHDFTSKKEIRKELTGVYVTPMAIVATDSFKLIEIRQVNEIEKPFIMALPKGIKSVHSVSEVDGKATFTAIEGGVTMIASKVDGEYPTYKQLMDKPAINSVRLSSYHLEAIAKAFSKKGNSFDYIDVDFCGSMEAVRFSNGNITALLMPINK